GQYYLGLAYFEGKFVGHKDVGKALSWILSSAQQGYQPAELFLGNIYRTGDGVVKDEEKAVGFLESAADVPTETSGIDSVEAEASYWLGVMYENGINGDKVDLAEAVRRYSDAAGGHHLKAELALGRIYLNGGDGVPADRVTAVRWYEAAAAEGSDE